MVRFMLVCAACLIFAPVRPVFAQADRARQTIVPAADDDATSKAYALKACPKLRDEMKDPASFTLLQLVAITRTDKDPAKKSVFRGCIHYVASNSFGGREQAWGAYYVDRKEQLNVFGGEPGNSSLNCMSLHKRETSVDVTADAVSFLRAK